MKTSLTLFVFPLLAGAVWGQSTSGGWRRFNDTENSQVAQASQAAPAEARRDAGPVPSQLTIPAGTYIRVRVDDAISSDQNHPGDAFTMTLTQPVIAQGIVVARRGQTLGGRVASVEKAGRIKGTSRLGLELTDLALADGQQIPMRSELIQFSGGTTLGRDATAIATSSGIGAIIGAAAQGGAAAGIGAAAGAAAATIGVLATRGRATVVYPEDMLTFRTLAPIPVSTDAAPQAFQAVQQGDYEPANQTRRPARLATRPARYGYPYPYGGIYGPWGYPYPYYGPRIFVYGRVYGGGRRYR